MAVFIPLNDPFRDPLLILEAFLIVLCIQMGLVYVRKFLKTKSNYAILAWGGLLFSYAGVFTIYIFSDFYIDQDLVGLVSRVNVLGLAYIMALIGVFLFSYYTEREIKLKKHFLSIIALCLIGFLTLNMFIPMINPTYITIAGWLLFLIIIIIYIREFTSKISEKWRINVYSLVIGTIIIVLGFGGTADVIVEALGGLWVRFVGDFLMFVGMLLISALFIGVPSLGEFDWYQKIRYLNVVHQSGVSVSHFDFKKGDSDESSKTDELLMAGGLTSISQIVSDIIKSEKKLDLVHHGDVSILFEYGKNVINILIVDEPLEILRTKLKKFTEQIELIYKDYLADWDGDLDQYPLIKPLIKANFFK